MIARHLVLEKLYLMESRTLLILLLLCVGMSETSYEANLQRIGSFVLFC